jgi:hypothetical protein
MSRCSSAYVQGARLLVGLSGPVSPRVSERVRLVDRSIYLVWPQDPGDRGPETQRRRIVADFLTSDSLHIRMGEDRSRASVGFDRPSLED